jgi:hypothetical protein
MNGGKGEGLCIHNVLPPYQTQRNRGKDIRDDGLLNTREIRVGGCDGIAPTRTARR